MGQDVTLRSAKKIKRLLNRTLPALEDALLHYMMEIMWFMNIQTLFRVTAVSQKALQVRNRLVSDLHKTLEDDMSDSRRNHIMEQHRIYSEVNASV